MNTNVVLEGKSDFSDVNKGHPLKQIILDPVRISHESLKAGNFLWLEAEQTTAQEQQRDPGSEKDALCLPGSEVQEPEGGLEVVRAAPS